MKKNSSPRFAFVNPRLLLSLVFCSIGVLLVLLAFALYPGATAVAKEAQLNPLDPLGGPTTAGELIIAEFRLRGGGGANDEFIDLYNTTGATLTTQSANGSAGLSVAASDGMARCIIPNGTIIPAGGHFLCTNSVSYSLGTYPSGTGATATGNLTYTLNIPDNSGIALFNNATGGASFSVANRLDAAGPVAEPNAIYREGAGYPSLTPFSVDASLVRRLPGGCTGSGVAPNGNCNSVALLSTTSGPTSTQPQDTDSNSADFIYVDTNGTSAGAGQRLGAPGPQNLAAPRVLDTPSIGIGLRVKLLDACAPENRGPNYARDMTSAPANNSTFGTLDIRRTLTNNTGAPITRLRFRVVDITTFPSISGAADLRPISSTDLPPVRVDREGCGSVAGVAVVRGTTLEQPPAQPNGGGYNTTLSVDSVTPGNAFANAASMDVRFLLGVEQTGVARFCVVPETEPVSQSQVSCFTPQDITAAIAPSCVTTIFREYFDSGPAPALPAGWVSSFSNGAGNCAPMPPNCALGTQWVTDFDANNFDTSAKTLFHNDPSCVMDASVDTPSIPINSSTAQLTFRNYYNTETGFDGGVLEILSPNINNGAFTDILSAGGSFVSGGYNKTISAGFQSPIGNRQAWSGNSGGYITTQVNLPAAAAGQGITLRFRMASDCNVGVAAGGWRIDTLTVTDGCAKSLNIATRMRVETGDNVLIGGFIVTGNASKNVAVRAIGPSLIPFGIADALVDPTLELRASNGTIILQNDNWQDNPAQAAQLIAVNLAPQNLLESALIATLAPNASYTAVVAGKNGGTGVGLAEVYDLNGTADSQLDNISTRGFVQTGGNVMIGGFILGGNNLSSGIAVRGIGPSLAQFGISPVLANPTLELRDANAALLVGNDNWQDDPATAIRLVFFGLAPADPNESGIFASLPLGPFTAILAGKNGGTGIGLVEIYNVH